jgi:hypothetical protein
MTTGSARSGPVKARWGNMEAEDGPGGLPHDGHPAIAQATGRERAKLMGCKLRVIAAVFARKCRSIPVTVELPAPNAINISKTN